MYTIDYTPYKLTPFIEDFFEVDIWDRICQNPGAINIIRDKIRTHPEMINFEILLRNENIYQLFIERGNVLNDFLIHQENLSESCRNELLYCIPGVNNEVSKNISVHASSEAISYLQLHAPYLLDVDSLSENPQAINFLENNLEMINWSKLSGNSGAIHLLQNNFTKINWDRLSLNPNALTLLEQHPHLINWKNLSANPGAIKLLEQHQELINWDKLSGNSEAIYLLKQDINKINWCQLSANHKSYELLDVYFQDKEIQKFLYRMPNEQPFRDLVSKYYHLIEPLLNIDSFEIPVLTFRLLNEKDKYLQSYIKLKLNEYSSFLELNPRAIGFIQKNLYRIDYYNLCKNPNAIHLLENQNTLDMCQLSRCSSAICILEKKKYQINWTNISVNPHASQLIKYNLDRINWDLLASNQGAVNLITNNLEFLSNSGWRILSKNPQAISILENNLDKVDWEALSLNIKAIQILEQNIDKIDWVSLCKNINAIPIIEKNLHRLNDDCWNSLSLNSSAISLLKRFPEKISWRALLKNPQGYQILESRIIDKDPFIIKNMAKLATQENNIYLLKYISHFFLKFTYINENYPVDTILNEIYEYICKYNHALVWLINNNKLFFKWFKNRSRQLKYNDFYFGTYQENMSFLKNPSIFQIDYQTLKLRIEIIKEELMQKCFHPNRLIYYYYKYGYDIGEEIYINE